MKNIAIIVLGIFLMLSSNIGAQEISMKKSRLIEDWQFLKQDVGGIWEVFRSSAPGQPTSVPVWQGVKIPHCYNNFDAVDPDVNYYQGPAWYRNALSVDNPFHNGRTLLHFEGAGQKTNVYVGLNEVAAHVGGYDEWFVDITDYIDSANDYQGMRKEFVDKVPVAIRCDNSRDVDLIPSDLSDFNIYGGLYRYVNLIYVPEAYVSHVKINPDINGTINLQGQLYNPMKKRVELRVEIINPEKELVYENKFSFTSDNFSELAKIEKVDLWSVENPDLYTLKITLDINNEQQFYEDHFGFRSFHFEKHGPFYLNNERLLLQGTHRHEDHAGVGAAMTEDMIREEMIMIKEMGANFIRLGHYQQSRIVLDLCDSLGILVWEEIPWCRGGLGGKKYQKTARNMLANMIQQHYNHPSIIIWGLGNENDWPGDFKTFEQDEIRNFMTGLNNLSHELDSTRKTAIRRCEFCKDIVDVYSPSIWAGWYRGKYTEYQKVSLEQMKTVDRFLHAEWGGSSHAGRHSENPDHGIENIKTGGGADEKIGDASFYGGEARVSKDGDWTETYICNLFDWTLKEQENMDWLSGSAFWIFKDFSTPIRPQNPIPYVNQKGVVQRDLTPKESYYLFQSYWSKKPMVHIYGKSWPTRYGEPGQKRMVKVYSNCDNVELFLNGKSLGEKHRNAQDFPAAGLRWDVFFKKGLNQLIAVARTPDAVLHDTAQVDYQVKKWGAPKRLTMEEIVIDNQFSLLEVKALDENGILCLDAKHRVQFSIIGEAKLIDNMGTNGGSRVIEMCNGVARIKIKKYGNCFSARVQSHDGINAMLVHNE